MDYKKEIINELRNMSGRYSVYDMFQDWIKMLALSISNSCNPFFYEKREREYLELAHKHTPEEIDVFCKLNNLLIMACNEKFEDVLGYIYMHLEVSSKALGQFFTPYHVCQLMANISVKEINCDYIINEPSCGAGGNIIAAAERLKERGINYQDEMKVICQDLDWKSVYMCYVQLSLYGIPAVVVQGDTLANPYTSGISENVLVTPLGVMHFSMFRTSNTYGQSEQE